MTLCRKDGKKIHVSAHFGCGKPESSAPLVSNQPSHIFLFGLIWMKRNILRVIQGEQAALVDTFIQEALNHFLKTDYLPCTENLLRSLLGDATSATVYLCLEFCASELFYHRYSQKESDQQVHPSKPGRLNV